MALFYIFVNLFNDWPNARTWILLSASAFNMWQFVALKSMKKNLVSYRYVVGNSADIVVILFFFFFWCHTKSWQLELFKKLSLQHIIWNHSNNFLNSVKWKGTGLACNRVHLAPHSDSALGGVGSWEIVVHWLLQIFQTWTQFTIKYKMKSHTFASEKPLDIGKW